MRRVRSLVPIALALTLTGCGAGGQFEHDPLMGGPPLRGRPAPAPSRGSSSPLASALPPGQVPPPPPPYSTTSAAALAGSTSRGGLVPEARQDGPGQAGPGQTGFGQTGQGGQGRLVPTPGSGVALVGGPPRAEAGYEQIQAQLAARGVTMQHLQTVGERGEWKFSCAVPSRQSPDLRRVYQATASGAGGVAAMKAVLEEIDRTQGGAP